MKRPRPARELRNDNNNNNHSFNTARASSMTTNWPSRLFLERQIERAEPGELARPDPSSLLIAISRTIGSCVFLFRGANATRPLRLGKGAPLIRCVATNERTSERTNNSTGYRTGDHVGAQTDRCHTGRRLGRSPLAEIGRGALFARAAELAATHPVLVCAASFRRATLPGS